MEPESFSFILPLNTASADLGVEMEPLRTLINSGYSRARRGEYHAASEDFRTVLSHDPNHVGALYGMAACLHRMGEDEAAAEHLHHLLRIHPQHPQAARLLNEIQDLKLDEKGFRGPTEDPLNSDRGAYDPFGTGLDKRSREFEILDEWKLPGRDAPGIGETLLEGKGTHSGVFSIGRSYSGAFRLLRTHFRILLLGAWLSLFVWAGIIAPYAASILDWFGRGGPLSPVRLLAILLALPLLGFYSGFCFRLRVEGEASFLDIPRFVRYYPNLLFCLGWLLAPALIAAPVIYTLSWFIGLFLEFPLADRVYENLFWMGASGTVYLWWRCWFIHQVVYHTPDLHPLTQLGRAYYASSGQQIRLAAFTLTQTVFLLLGLLTLGLLFPIPNAAQNEAYLQVLEESEESGEGIGFRPKGAGEE